MILCDTLLSLISSYHRTHFEVYMSTPSVHLIEKQVFLTPREVSDLLHVSVQTVRRWIKDEKLPAYRIGPRMWRISKGDLDEWLRRSAMASGSEDKPLESTTVCSVPQ